MPMPVMVEVGVSGNHVTIQNPDPLVVEQILATGWFTQIRGVAGTENYFHFAIPTLVATSSSALGSQPEHVCVRAIKLRWEGSPDAVVAQILLMDGSSLLHSLDFEDDISALHQAGMGTLVAEVPGFQPVGSGLGLSVKVRFGAPPASGEAREIRLISAACLFGPVP